MKQEEYNVFSEYNNEGNPATVIPIRLSESENYNLLDIAKENKGVSVFVTLHDLIVKDVLIYSSSERINFCGHGILALYRFLNSNCINCDHLTLGDKKVSFSVTEDKYWFSTDSANIRKAELDVDLVAEAFGLHASDFVEPEFYEASIGSPKLLVELEDLNTIKKVNPHFELIKRISLDYKFNGFFLFTRDTIDPSSDFFARSFNPLSGIQEDIATGVAAGALGLVLKKRYGDLQEFKVEQGHLFDNRCKIFIKEVNGSIFVGGHVTPR
ncbi:PhzF family phenazine biosynthesis protein [Shouchella patagoniensis]|uniref:PhzF family phenazine biosynthesis protein n=1 Tax=Shouchella patagoniensis TaxID=228576 RepID=UPI001474EF99|nr:PhzF family phenazine biosynthesis isomerase [Shouchella patagoniensis]